MLEYAAGAGDAIAYLKESENDVDIFVEDVAGVRAWNYVIQNILQGSGKKFKSVTALGSRQAVIDECKKYRTRTDRKRLFIIDRDMDDLIRSGLRRLAQLHTLEVSCFENAIINPNSLSDIAADAAGIADPADARQLFDFGNLLAELEAAFRVTFVLFGVSQRLETGLKCSKIGSGRFVLANKNLRRQMNSTVIPKAIFKFNLAFARDIIRHASVAEFRRELRIVKASALGVNGKKFISGKYFIAPPVLSRLSANFGYNGSKSQLVIELGRRFEPAFSPKLARRVKAL